MNRLQILRSSVTGQQPTAGTRAAGELWVTFPDKQLGIIDTTRTAQPLIAVRFFSTAANYATGDFVIQAGALYVAKASITAGAFNATQWTKIAAATDAGGPYLPVSVAASTYLPLAGGTLTGKLVLAGPPTNPLDAVTKAYADSGAFIPASGAANTGLNDNRVINGDMRIDQRNAGAITTPTAPGYFTVDRWRASVAAPSKLSFQRVVNGPGMTANGWPYSLAVSTATAYTPAAGEGFSLTQFIEAEMISDFGFGNSVAQPITLSFWALCTGVTGTFGGAIKNTDNTRSYPFSFSLVASTWTRIVVTIPGDTTGTWVLAGNGAGLAVTFDLGSGATLRAPANAWVSGNYNGVTGAVSLVATASAQLWITGVKLEIGSVATPYNRQSLAKSMADCQRYYQSNAQIMVAGYAPGAGGSGPGSSFRHPVTMRADPTVGLGTPNYSNASAMTVNHVDLNQVRLQATITAAGIWWAVAAPLTLYAEL